MLRCCGVKVVREDRFSEDRCSCFTYDSVTEGSFQLLFNIILISQFLLPLHHHLLSVFACATIIIILGIEFYFCFSFGFHLLNVLHFFLLSKRW